MSTRNHENAPRDRGIWIVANIITRGVSLHEVDEYAIEDSTPGCLTCVDPYEGYARLDGEEWVDRQGMSIRRDAESELRILEWKELEERAVGAPECEFTADDAVYFWDTEYRREMNQVGFFALFSYWHSPTGLKVDDRTEGPFRTQGEAMGAAAKMMLNASVNRPMLSKGKRIAA